MKLHKRIAVLASAIGLLTQVFTFVPVSAASTTQIVTPSRLANNLADVLARPDSWFFYNDENDTINSALGSFVSGPGTAPLGNGSAQISVTGTQRRNIATYQFAGTPLASITQLKFSTHNPSVGNGGSATRSAYLHFNVDFNGTDTWQRRLVYVPSVNGAVVQNSWQEWDAISSNNAKWLYSGLTWPVSGEPGTTTKTWGQILSQYPGIRIRVSDPWLGLRVGEPYADGYTENIDKFVLATATDTKTTDFEPYFPASGEIIKPKADKHYDKKLKLKATYTDGDTVNDNAVLWAVRAGTCAAGTNTVFGNVDGKTDSSEWDGQTFTASLDIRNTTPGKYCFVFNPQDDPGQNDVRLTREFYIDAYVPHDKDDCKKNGWKDFTNPSFKNQGKCIEFVEKNKDHDHHEHDEDEDDDNHHGEHHSRGIWNRFNRWFN